MCTEESHPNSKKQIHHGFFKRHKSRFIFRLNKVVSGDFVFPIYPLLGMGVWSCLLVGVVSGRNSAPDSLYQQCNLFTVAGSGLPVGIPGCNWERVRQQRNVLYIQIDVSWVLYVPFQQQLHRCIAVQIPSIQGCKYIKQCICLCKAFLWGASMCF